MKKILIVFVLLLGAGVFAQPQDLSPLPENQQVKKGVLSNGMTYYIYPTDVVKDAASYYMMQNVGSILENEDQRGLAHFLEHMAFNGTENFPDKALLSTLQKHGAVFGKDINAYTSFDETVYNINNIPTTPELVDISLLILRDWSNYLTLDDEEIDLERGVIKEEWRTRQSGSMRILENNLATVYNNSRYAERMPIGLMEVVDNFEYDALKQFYHDWYRTDLQAIAVIGDVDVEAIEKKVKKLFSPIPAVENPKERFIENIPDNEELMYNMAMDKEITTPSITFGIRHDRNLQEKTVSDLKEALLNGMVTSMLSDRLRELVDKPDAPFLNAFISLVYNSRSSQAFTVSVRPKPGKQHEAFEATIKEVNRAVKFGFTPGEVNRSIEKSKTSYENRISKEENKSHRMIQAMIQGNYLYNETMTDVTQEYEIVKQIFENLTPADFHSKIKELYSDKNRYITVTGVEGKNNLSQIEALEIISAIENDETLVAYEDIAEGKTLMDNVKIKEGKIRSQKENEDVGATTYTLSNGVKVHYKFADKDKNDVKLRALSYGGFSLVEDADLASAKYLSSLIRRSGLGDYSRNELNKLLAGKTASTRILISGISEGIYGSSSVKDTETMLQMLHLRFTNPRFDKDGYQVLIGNLENQLISRRENINTKIGDSIKVALYGKDNVKQPLMTQEYIDKISFKTMQEVYAKRFANAADFEFFVVGDIPEEELKPLLEKYIASLPTKKYREQYKDNSAEWVSDAIDKDIYLPMENPKSTVRIMYKNDFEYSLKNEMLSKALGDILKLRYTETLREQEGGTYGASAFVRLSKRPAEEGSVFIGFDCNPDMVDRLVDIVHNELQKIVAGDINQEDLSKSTTNYLKERVQQKSHNRYEMQLLTNFFRENYNMNDPSNFEEIVKSISTSDVQEFAQKMVEGAKTSQIIVKPAQ